MKEKILTREETSTLLVILKNRIQKNEYNLNLEWKIMEEKLLKNPQKILSLHQMEFSGGEPNVVDYNKITNEYIFMDCSAESPKERRSWCYDLEALEKRKENKPKNSAFEVAKFMKIEILTEEQYRFLQKLGDFDTKTSSWLKTPENIRKLGGAIFGDKRYNHIFIYHNGAESYYAARGFRGVLIV